MSNEKIFELVSKANLINQTIEKQQNEVHNIEDQIKSMLPKGYWYTYDVDKNWHYPKKYSVKKVECGTQNARITVKEVFKKKPWPSFTGETTYYLKDFLNLSIHKTEQESIDAYYNRICPKCGCPMMNSHETWCDSCMTERKLIAKEFENSHRFYNSVNKSTYHVEYEDELTSPYERGFDGKYFKIMRLDTGEIIHTRNLWSDNIGENTNNLPEIKFLPAKE